MGTERQKLRLNLKRLFIDLINMSAARFKVCLLGFVYCHSESTTCWKRMIFHLQSACTSAVVKDQCENQPMFLSSTHAEL